MYKLIAIVRQQGSFRRIIIKAYDNIVCWVQLQQLLVPGNTCDNNKEQCYSTSRHWDARRVASPGTSALPRRPRSAANKCNIPPKNAACGKTLTHQHGRSNRPIRLSLSTAPVFVSRLSGPKSQPCSSRISRVSLPCRISRRTQQSYTTSSHNSTTNTRRRWVLGWNLRAFMFTLLLSSVSTNGWNIFVCYRH